MDWNNLLEKAIVLATQAHAGQKRPDGTPYILHPLRVMMAQTTIQGQIVAVLHDILEDTNFSAERLEWGGIPPDLVYQVKALTRLRESYKSYITNIANFELAKQVKIADLKDNMNLLDLPEITDRDLQRQKKYAMALKYLQGVIPAFE
jgi:(p)ppGpp synthase/HD superfamily hydrolase